VTESFEGSATARDESHTSHVVSPTVYYAIFGALMILTALTVLVAFVDLGLMNPVVALSIAVLKATLVVLFFMHLRWSSRLTWIVGGAALFWLGILLTLTLSDYATRAWGWY
jgi:cytochrome c oxidase subunit 4